MAELLEALLDIRHAGRVDFEVWRGGRGIATSGSVYEPNFAPIKSASGAIHPGSIFRRSRVSVRTGEVGCREELKLFGYSQYGGMSSSQSKGGFAMDQQFCACQEFSLPGICVSPIGERGPPCNSQNGGRRRLWGAATGAGTGAGVGVGTLCIASPNKPTRPRYRRASDSLYPGMTSYGKKKNQMLHGLRLGARGCELIRMK